MDNSSIKKNIRRIRKARKLTQEEMAHRLGISLTAYRDLEKGSTSVVNGHIMKMAMLLNTSTEEIVLGYKPVQAEGATVEDVQEEYSIRITSYEKRINDLEKIIATLEETVRTKNDVILMLKKRLDKEK